MKTIDRTPKTEVESSDEAAYIEIEVDRQSGYLPFDRQANETSLD